MNIETQGVPGVFMWIGIISAAFIAMGYIFFGLDQIKKKCEVKEAESTEEALEDNAPALDGAEDVEKEEILEENITANENIAVDNSTENKELKAE